MGEAVCRQYSPAQHTAHIEARSSSTSRAGFPDNPAGSVKVWEVLEPLTGDITLLTSGVGLRLLDQSSVPQLELSAREGWGQQTAGASPHNAEGSADTKKAVSSERSPLRKLSESLTLPGWLGTLSPPHRPQRH